MAKLDLKVAYKIIPVYPEDQPLLGIKWQEVYVDQALPFDLFTAVADGLAWAMEQGVHHLMTFCFAALLSHKIAPRYLKLPSPTGTPSGPYKVEGPSTTLTLLGILYSEKFWWGKILAILCKWLFGE